MKRNTPNPRLIPLGRVSRETRSIQGALPEQSNVIFSYTPL